VIAGNQILDGPDFTCNSQAQGDDVQGNGACGRRRQVGDLQPPLNGFEDWNRLFYEFSTLPNFANGIASPVQDEPTPETIEEAKRLFRGMSKPVLVLDKTAAGTASPGATITFTIRVGNEGSGPALGVLLTDTDPSGVEQKFNLGTIESGTQVEQNVEFTVPPDACARNLTNTAIVQYKDMTGDEHSASDSVTVGADTTAPSLSVTLSPSRLAPPNHQLVEVTANIQVSDTCDPDPIVKLVSITSNEPDSSRDPNIPDVPNDIQGAALGTDDRQFQVRAERLGTGTGRVYTVTYEAEDTSGNKTTQQAVITVPLN
jgi:uncharacterized repeat protein (TIGR01451 family)